MAYITDPETGQQSWQGSGPELGSPWANNRTGWSSENLDALFNEYAKSEAGNVGAQTLAGLRQQGVAPEAALEALWSGARASANPNWAGGSPTGISRNIWSHAGVLDKLDSAQLRSAQAQEDQNIWQWQQQDDEGFGGILGIGAGLLGAYFGMPYLGTLFNAATTGKVSPLSLLGSLGGLSGGEGLEGFGTEYQGDFGYPDDFSSSFGTTYQGDYGYEGDTPSFEGTEYQGDFGYEGDTNFAPVEDRGTIFNPASQRPLSWSSLVDTGSQRLLPSGLSGLLGGSPGSGGNALSVLSSLGSGIYGMLQANKLKKLALQQGDSIREATSAADPWGTSGGRSNAAQALLALQADPTGEMAKDPRFAAMVQASQRATAPYGQNSGAMAVAGAKAGGDWFTQRQAELAGLAGTGNAGIAAQGRISAADAAMRGQTAGATLAGQGLASIGYGINTATGGQATSSMPPQVLAWLRQNGMIP